MFRQRTSILFLANVHSVQEAEAEGQFIELVGKDRSSDFEHCKLVRGREDSQVPLDFLA